jgi:hypothetical protein
MIIYGGRGVSFQLMDFDFRLGLDSDKSSGAGGGIT